MAVSWSAGFGAEPVWTPNSRGLYYRGKNRMHFAALTSGSTLAVVRRDTLFADPNRRELLVVTYDGRLWTYPEKVDAYLKGTTRPSVTVLRTLPD